jgi:uncharacterized protein (TIGR04206 family)
MWARSEYAGELAVLATWLCALLPWSVTLFSPQGLTALTFRFLPLRLLYIFGTELPGERPLLFVWQVPGFVATPGETLAAQAWMIAVAVFLVPLGFSVVYYLYEGAVEARVDPVRTLGLLLIYSGMVFLIPVAQHWQATAGTTVPVGVLFQFGFGLMLLGTERV